LIRWQYQTLFWLIKSIVSYRGNVIGAQPYLTGNPSCSAQGVTPSHRYEGLCGKFTITQPYNAFINTVRHFLLLLYQILKHLSSFSTEVNGYRSLGASCQYNSPYGNYGSTTVSSQQYTSRTYTTASPFTQHAYASTQHTFVSTQQAYTPTQNPFSPLGFRQHYYG
jgi:hypothetical protein